jgi:hypothetical protein
MSSAGATVGRTTDLVDAARFRVVVLDREARGSGLGEQLHSSRYTSRVVRIAALAVDVEGQICRSRERRDMCDELVARNGLVEPADRPGKAGARRGERLEAGGLEQSGGADVPRIRHHEHLLFLMKRPEPGSPFCGGVAHVIGRASPTTSSICR